MSVDKPTDNQLGALYGWYKWRLPGDLARHAIKWLEEHATRQQVSVEMARARKLYHSHTLDKNTCFDSPIWDGYRVKEVEE